MSKSSGYLIIIVFVLITSPIFLITIPLLIIMNNGLVSKKNKIEFAFSSIDVMLKKRFDLIPNIVSSVKTYMNHEKELLTKITALRSGFQNVDSNSTERFEMENELSGLLSSLNVNIENYPDIKSNENIIHLQKTLNETEEQISAARRVYNAAVLNYNNSVESIPTNILAGAKAYKTASFFKVPEAEKTTPNVGQLFS